MAPPWLALGALILAKKALAVSLYKAGASYGWPRLYRRLLETNRRVSPPSSRQLVQRSIASTFRFPQTALSILQDPVLRNFLNALAATSTAKAFPVAPGVSLATVIHAAMNLPPSIVQSVANSVTKEGKASPHPPK